MRANKKYRGSPSVVLFTSRTGGGEPGNEAIGGLGMSSEASKVKVLLPPVVKAVFLACMVC